MNKEYINFKTNHLERIFKKYHRKLFWDWHALSGNPNISTTLIEDYYNCKWQWNYGGISDNINIDIDFVLDNSDQLWNSFCLSRNPAMGKYIGQPDTVDWVWAYVCLNKEIPEGVLEQNIDKLNFERLSNNESLSWKFIEDNMSKPWNWDIISTLPCINIEIVKSHPEIDWNWYSLSTNSSISIEDIKNNPKLPWDKNKICTNPNLTIYDVIYDRHLFNNWTQITVNENIKQIDIEKYPNLPWDINVILNLKSGLDINFILNYYQKNYQWNWNEISRSYSISINDVINNPTLPWCMYTLSENPSLTLETFERFFYRFKNCNNISSNLFLYDKDYCTKMIKNDTERRKRDVNHKIKDIFYNDICGEIIKYVGYN